jgi:hypothetical protein
MIYYNYVPSDPSQVLVRVHIFLNTSLTESFGIAILEAACAGLYVVSTRVDGVSEVLPPNMVSFARPDGVDVLRACVEAIARLRAGMHGPHHAHERVRNFYGWEWAADRMERVYETLMVTPQRDFWTRIQRPVVYFHVWPNSNHSSVQDYGPGSIRGAYIHNDLDRRVPLPPITRVVAASRRPRLRAKRKGYLILSA